MAMRIVRRPSLLALAAAGSLALGALVLTAWVFAARGGDSPAVDLLPNLVQAPPGKLNGRDGGTPARPTFFLGFESAAANVGAGPLVVAGLRLDTRAPRMRLWQELSRSDGSTRRLPVRATLRYVRSPDHSHWHLLGFMRYELRDARGNRILRDRKTGFCLGDRYTVEPPVRGRATTPAFPDRCGEGAPRLRSIREGISVGWGDDYAANLEGQEFDVTSLPPGRYVIVHRVNPERILRESDSSDNTASMAIDLTWPRGRKQPPRIDVVARCEGAAVCP